MACLTGLDENSTLGLVQNQMQWNVVNRLAGLGAPVWFAGIERAWRLARRIEAGSVFASAYRAGSSAMPLPFGGFTQSGVGRNHGLEPALACMEQQAVVEFDDPAAVPGTGYWSTHLCRGSCRVPGATYRHKEINTRKRVFWVLIHEYAQIA